MGAPCSVGCLFFRCSWPCWASASLRSCRVSVLLLRAAILVASPRPWWAAGMSAHLVRLKNAHQPQLRSSRTRWWMSPCFSSRRAVPARWPPWRRRPAVLAGPRWRHLSSRGCNDLLGRLPCAPDGQTLPVRAGPLSPLNLVWSGPLPRSARWHCPRRLHFLFSFRPRDHHEQFPSKLSKRPRHDWRR
jgi:hypothetical protein